MSFYCLVWLWRQLIEIRVLKTWKIFCQNLGVFLLFSNDTTIVFQNNTLIVERLLFPGWNIRSITKIWILRFDTVGMAQGKDQIRKFLFLFIFQLRHQFLALLGGKLPGGVFKDGFRGFGRRNDKTEQWRPRFQDRVLQCWLSAVSKLKRLCLLGLLKSREKPADLCGLSRPSRQRNRPKQ